MSDVYTITKNDRLSESILYASNTVLELAKSRKVFAITTSSKYKKPKDYVVTKLAEAMFDKNKKVLIVDHYITNAASEEIEIRHEQSGDIAAVKNASVGSVSAFLEETKSSYDIILFNLPPIWIASMAIEYAKLSDGAILIERLAHTEYKSYENSLLALKQHDVPILGVITYK